MKSTTVLAAALASYLLVGSWRAHAADSEELAQLKEQTELLNAKKALAEARFGAPIKGREGDITGTSGLSGIVQQQSFRLSGATANALADKLAGVPKDSCQTIVVTDSADATAKLLKTRSFQLKLKELEDGIDGILHPKSGISPLMVPTVAVIAGILGTANQLYGLVRSDYAVSDVSMAVDSSWTIGSMLIRQPTCTTAGGCPVLLSDTYPDLNQVGGWIKRLDALKNNAKLMKDSVDTTTKGKEDDESKAKRAAAKALFDAVVGFRTAMIEPNAAGIAPVVSLATFSGSSDPNNKMCVAHLVVGQSKGVLVTKNSIFGKGGKVYAHMPLQLAAIVTDVSGRPIRMFCTQQSFVHTIKLSTLTKNQSPQAPWDKTGPITDAQTLDCGGQELPVASIPQDASERSEAE